MKILITIITVALTVFTAKSQNDLVGVYQLKQKDIDSVFVGETITLKSDSTFLIERQPFRWKAVGKWNRGNDIVTFVLDTVYSKEHIIIEKSKWRFYLQNDTLIDATKIETKRQYKRRNRKFKIERQHPFTFENYSTYRNRQENLIYKKLSQ